MTNDQPMYRTFVIVRHTFREAIVQPIYTLLLVFGAAILVIFGLLPFFTLGEDTTMFKSVGLDVILLMVLIATLVSLVVNLPVVILIYIAGNLTRFLYPITGPTAPLGDRSWFVKGPAYLVSVTLPYLEAFDVRPLAIYHPLAMFEFANDPNAVPLSMLFTYLLISAAYAIAYATFALSVGTWLVQTR